MYVNRNSGAEITDEQFNKLSGNLKSRYVKKAAAPAKAAPAKPPSKPENKDK